MKKIKKVVICVLLAMAMILSVVFGGCSITATDGLDGRDGKDLSINDIYESYKEDTGSDISLADFIKEYLSYNDEEISNSLSLQSVINRALLSAVSVQAIYSGGSSLGSGVIVKVDKDTSGNVTAFYLVTNSHVIYNSANKSVNDGFSQNINIYVYGKEYSGYGMKASIVGVTKTYDLALLKVEGDDVNDQSVRAAEWSTDEEVYVGADLFTVGNSDGEGLSVTKGISSVSTESITLDLEDTTKTSDDYTYRVMRTDATINQGNSGGGLFDANGYLVGIVNAKQISTGVEGMGYALPSSTCRRIINNMLESYTGKETHGIDKVVLDVTTKSVNIERVLVQTDQLEVLQIKEMVTVSAIDSDSIVYGKLKVNDVIKNVRVISSDDVIKEDMPINRLHNLIDVLLSVNAGDRLVLTIKNGDKDTTTTVTLDIKSSDLTHFS